MSVKRRTHVVHADAKALCQNSEVRTTKIFKQTKTRVI